MAKIIITSIVLLVVFGLVIVILDNVNLSTATPTPSSDGRVIETPDYTTGNIEVFSPQEGDEVGLPLVIEGEARVFEGTFAYRIVNANGEIVLEGHAMTEGQSELGEFDGFEVAINYPDPKTASGLVEVFEYSAKDGSEINKVVVPVEFGPVDSMEVKVFFGLRGVTEESCTDMRSVTRRIPRTQTPVRASLEELLKGVYAAEAEAGYFTNINYGVFINSVNLASNGVLTVDFNDIMELGVGGSCRVTAIRAQVMQTAKQFTNVKSVIISVNGRTEDVLQP